MEGTIGKFLSLRMIGNICKFLSLSVSGKIPPRDDTRQSLRYHQESRAAKRNNTSMYKCFVLCNDILFENDIVLKNDIIPQQWLQPFRGSNLTKAVTVDPGIANNQQISKFGGRCLFRLNTVFSFNALATCHVRIHPTRWIVYSASLSRDIEEQPRKTPRNNQQHKKKKLRKKVKKLKIKFQAQIKKLKKNFLNLKRN